MGLFTAVLENKLRLFFHIFFFLSLSYYILIISCVLFYKKENKILNLPLLWDFRADSPILPMSNSFWHSVHLALCLFVAGTSQSLYSSFNCHKLLYTQSPGIVKLTLIYKINLICKYSELGNV